MMKKFVWHKEAPAAETHFRRKGHRPALSSRLHRHHSLPLRTTLKFDEWHGIEPHFAPDFVVLLLITGALIALLYLLSLLSGVHLVTPGEIPGHPS